MSQHDLDIANAAGAAVRADLNLALVALGTNGSGATAPATTFAYQMWADTTAGLMKQRNAANSAWITLFTLSGGPLDRAGGTMTGALTLSGAPTVDLHAATKLYVDGLASTVKQNREVLNAGIAVTMAANAVTIALKGADGNDPSATNTVKIGFRSATLTSGVVNERSITAALSTAISSGSTGGTVSAQASRIWIAAIDNAGTVELAWYQSLSGTNIKGFNENGVITTTAEGGAGAADSAQTWYSTTARTAVPFTIVGYYESTQTTAGTWATAASVIMVNPGDRPGDILQDVGTSTGAVATGTTVIPYDDTIPQITEGDQYLSLSFTPTFAGNVCRHETYLQFASSAGSTGASVLALFQGAGADALATMGITEGAGAVMLILSLTHRGVVGTAASTTFTVRAGNSAAGTTTINGKSGARTYGGKHNSYLQSTEYMT